MGVDVFAYARADLAAVRRLTEDVQLGGHQVWFDRDLHGGEDWWGRILERIRTCSVLVFALSQHSLRSQACRAELDYAEALGVPVLPIQVGAVESLATTRVARYQIIDGREQSAALGYRVMSAIAEGAARRGPLPDPLPPEPEIPFAYLSAVGRQIAQPILRSTQQAAIIGQLRHALRDEDDEDARADARRLLAELRRHPECTYANAQEIDTILAGPGSGSGPPSGSGLSSARASTGSDTAASTGSGSPSSTGTRPESSTGTDSSSSTGGGRAEGPTQVRRAHRPRSPCRQPLRPLGEPLRNRPSRREIVQRCGGGSPSPRSSVSCS